MMTGTGRVTVGESAASKKYRMTMAADKKLVPPPSVEDAYKPFPIVLGEPPKPPRPQMSRPEPPRGLRTWENRNWGSRLQHSLGLYNHRRQDLKKERAEQAMRDFVRAKERYSDDGVRFARESREYEENKKLYMNPIITPAPPPKPTLEQMSDSERAEAQLRKSIPLLGKRREQQFNYVLETQAACQDSYNKAVELLLLPNSEALAMLKAVDYLGATRELDKAKNKYIKLCDDESRIVNTLEAALDARFEHSTNENLSIVSEKIADDLADIRNLQDELRALSIPESVMQDANQASKDVATVIAEMQEKVRNDTRYQLGMKTHQQDGAQTYDKQAPLAS